MKFKVLYEVKPNMFGKLGGKMTLIGDDGSTPHTINWFLNKLIGFFSIKLNSKDEKDKEKKQLLKSISKIEVNNVVQIVNSENKIVALIQRVNDEATFAELLEEELSYFLV